MDKFTEHWPPDVPAVVAYVARGRATVSTAGRWGGGYWNAIGRSDRFFYDHSY
jgi:hypothetical protein